MKKLFSLLTLLALSVAVIGCGGTSSSGTPKKGDTPVKPGDDKKHEDKKGDDKKHEDKKGEDKKTEEKTPPPLPPIKEEKKEEKKEK
jgi:hypothetical protein